MKILSAEQINRIIYASGDVLDVNSAAAVVIVVAAVAVASARPRSIEMICDDCWNFSRRDSSYCRLGDDARQYPVATTVARCTTPSTTAMHRPNLATVPVSPRRMHRLDGCAGAGTSIGMCPSPRCK